MCLGLLSLTMCRWQPFVPEPGINSPTYRPVYITTASLQTLALIGPQPLKNPGKIYVKDTYLFINEVGTGFHIVDNTDPANPRKLAFVGIPGNTDMAIKGSTLYANNGPDLLVYSIADLTNITLTKRVPNVLPLPNQFPDATNVRFECPDPRRGYIVRWEAAPVNNPACFR